MQFEDSDKGYRYNYRRSWDRCEVAKVKAEMKLQLQSIWKKPKTIELFVEKGQFRFTHRLYEAM
jgi:hypothetical protein